LFARIGEAMVERVECAECGLKTYPDAMCTSCGAFNPKRKTSPADALIDLVERLGKLTRKGDEDDG